MIYKDYIIERVNYSSFSSYKGCKYAFSKRLVTSAHGKNDFARYKKVALSCCFVLERSLRSFNLEKKVYGWMQILFTDNLILFLLKS